MPIKILHIDDDEADHFLLKRALHPIFESHELIWVKNKQDFNDLNSGQYIPDVIILDFVLKGYTALEIIPLVKENFPQTPILVLTAYEGPGMNEALPQLGLNDIFMKKDIAIFIAYLQGKFSAKNIGAN
jgi:CheY-like chemotaxis protein